MVRPKLPPEGPPCRQPVRPPVTTTQLDMFPFDNVAESLDVIERTFGFKPKRLADHIEYVRRTDLPSHR